MRSSFAQVCLLALAGCTVAIHDDSSGKSPKGLKRLLREHAFREQPTLNPTTLFEIEEYCVEGLKESMNIQLFLIRYLSPDGQQFSERMQIYNDGALTTFGGNFGGHGLMSAAVNEDRLFYTYSWGSGIHRSHVGALSMMKGRLQILETDAFLNRDLFVRNVNGELLVEVGDYLDFNFWNKSDVLGNPKLTENSLFIIDDDGHERKGHKAW